MRALFCILRYSQTGERLRHRGRLRPRSAPAAVQEADEELADTLDSLDDAVTVHDVAHANAADLQHQEAHGVHYLRYWVDEPQGKIFCLVDAPDAEAAATVHREAHGLVADEIYQVQEGA